MSTEQPAAPHVPRSSLRVLALGALGVVYGDIGTSPLYALRECFHGQHGIAATRDNVLGVLSLVFWALIFLISIKYLVFILRADNRGEGGILALMALVRPERVTRKRHWVLVALGLFGAALLYGDGMITPAISVLAAVEGLEVATHLFDPYVVPITIAILIGLFAIQRHGTGRVGAVFGPVVLLWFVTLAALGISGVARDPAVLAAINPVHAVAFFARNRLAGFLVLGAVFLVVTGGEALYADMGHFGKRPIRLAWFSVVLPALLLNYFGQGALLIQDPQMADNPFYRLAPAWSLYPLVVLATFATCIASQAVISGAFSLTRQAVQLGYCPRVEIVHTSAGEIGQIYIPGINWALMLSTIGLVLGFGESTNLAAAYGIAVTATMVITTLLAYVVERKVWGWRALTAGLLTAAFLIVDLAFFGANVVKIAQGGWFPLLVAAVVFTLLSTWKRGRDILAHRLRRASLPVEAFVADVAKRMPTRVAGTAVFLNPDPQGTPIALLHNLKHNRVLHEKNVFMAVVTEEVPHVSDQGRVKVEELGEGFWRVIARYGFMQDPDVPEALGLAREHGLAIDPRMATYFLSNNTLLPSKRPGMALWRERIFAFMSRNSTRPVQYFRIPPNRVVELGMQVEL
jgi:KUP system potassium uptake protein